MKRPGRIVIILSIITIFSFNSFSKLVFGLSQNPVWKMRICENCNSEKIFTVNDNKHIYMFNSPGWLQSYDIDNDSWTENGLYDLDNGSTIAVNIIKNNYLKKNRTVSLYNLSIGDQQVKYLDNVIFDDNSDYNNFVAVGGGRTAYLINLETGAMGKCDTRFHTYTAYW